MKSRLKGFFIIGILFITGSINAQEKKTIKLDEAIDLGIKNSKQLQINQAKIEEATALLKQAEEKRLPDANVSGAYMRMLSADFKLKSNNNGGGNGSNPPKISDAIYGILNASVPLYTGGRIKYGIESAKYLEQAAKLDADNNKDEVIQNIIEAFANLFKSKTAIRLLQENLNVSQERVKDFSNMEQNGLLARNDLLKAQLQSSNIELNLLDAENNWQLANIHMNIMLGLPVTTELMLDTTGIEKKNDTRNLQDYLQAASTNRKDIQSIEFQKKAAITNVKSVQAEMYPNLQLTGGYIAADIPGFLTTTAVNIGVGVSYNIGSLWKTKSKVQQAEARTKQIELTEGIMNDNINMQVNNSYLDLLKNRKKIEVYTKAVEQAEENYRIVKNKFDNSLATATDLLDADVAQFQARLSYTLARADAFVAYNKLLQTTGILSTELKK
jgi:outer membrane protein TolC